MNIYTNCRFYQINRPCQAHKVNGVRCEQCEHYSAIEERILVIKLDALGDVLRTTALLGPLKRLHPRSQITWVTRANAAPLFLRNSAVDRVLTVEANYLELLLSEDFDVAISPDAAPLPGSIMQLVHASRKYGFIADRKGDVVPLNAAAASWWLLGLNDELKRQNRRTYGEWLYDICELPKPIERPHLTPSAQAVRRVAAFIRDHLPEKQNRVCFCTGASDRWKEKRWKFHHYDELARQLQQCSPETAVILTGGPAETEFNEQLLRTNPGLIDGGTTNSVDTFSALIAACDWVVTPDSFGYHVACAVGTRAICIVGPTSPWELDLYGSNHVLYSKLDCIGCYLDACPFPITCMDRLTPEIVAQWIGGPRLAQDPHHAFVVLSGSYDARGESSGMS